MKVIHQKATITVVIRVLTMETLLEVVSHGWTTIIIVLLKTTFSNRNTVYYNLNKNTKNISKYTIKIFIKFIII